LEAGRLELVLRRVGALKSDALVNRVAFDGDRGLRVENKRVATLLVEEEFLRVEVDAVDVHEALHGRRV